MDTMFKGTLRLLPTGPHLDPGTCGALLGQRELGERGGTGTTLQCGSRGGAPRPQDPGTPLQRGGAPPLVAARSGRGPLAAVCRVLKCNSPGLRRSLSPGARPGAREGAAGGGGAASGAQRGPRTAGSPPLTLGLRLHPSPPRQRKGAGPGPGASSGGRSRAGGRQGAAGGKGLGG